MRVEAAEHAALRVQWSALGEYGAFARQVAGWTVLGCPGAPEHPWLSQVLGSGPGLEDALAELDGAGVVRAQVQLVGEPPELLAELGFVPQPVLLRLAAPAGGPGPVPGLRVVAAGPELAEVVAAVAAEAFGPGLPEHWRPPLGEPGWTQLVALDGDRPVATGALHVAGDVAWIGGGGTVPSARARGAQAALLAERLRRAGEQGASTVGVKVDPGSASLRNLRRAGFRVVRQVVQWRGAAGAGAPQGRDGAGPNGG